MPEREEEERWKAEDDLRTLLRAREIKGDKDRLRRAMKMAQAQMDELEELSSA